MGAVDSEGVSGQCCAWNGEVSGVNAIEKLLRLEKSFRYLS